MDIRCSLDSHPGNFAGNRRQGRFTTVIPYNLGAEIIRPQTKWPADGFSR